MSDNLPYELPGSEQTITIRALSVKNIDLLQSAQKQGKVANVLSEQIIPDCLNIPFKDYKKFLDGDEMATIIALRRATWGDHYQFEFTCPDCNSKSLKTIDLSKLPMKRLDPDQPHRGLEYYIYDGNNNLIFSLKWHIPTVADRIRSEKEMVQYIRATKSEQTFMTSFGMAARIDDISRIIKGDETKSVSILGSLEGYERRKKIREHIMDQDVSFVTEFMEGIEEFSCGVETGIDYTCENWNCRHEWKEDLPIKDSFFSSTKESSNAAKKQRRKGRVRTPWKRTSMETVEKPLPEQVPTATSEKSLEKSLEKSQETPSLEKSTSQESSSDSSSSSSLEPLSLPLSP